MFYRENGQFKTSYQADQQIFPIQQDRWFMLVLLLVALLLPVPFIKLAPGPTFNVIGAVGVNFGRSILTNYFPELWPFFLGGLFIAVVLLFPDGLVGLMRRMNTDVIRHLFVKGKPAPEGTQP